MEMSDRLARVEAIVEGLDSTIQRLSSVIVGEADSAHSLVALAHRTEARVSDLARRIEEHVAAETQYQQEQRSQHGTLKISLIAGAVGAITSATATTLLPALFHAQK